jgi:hypothetical protein
MLLGGQSASATILGEQEQYMLSTLRSLTGKKSEKKRTETAKRSRLKLEQLEQREVLSVTYNGGALLSNVEVQGLYYGSDWYNNSTYYSQTGYLEGFLNNIAHSSYMDMLNGDGYGVGRGSFDGGKISLANINKAYYLTDATLHGVLQSYINNGTLKSPDANRLYVIFVEDSVAVSNGSTNSQRDFLGYHGAFAGNDFYGRPADIHYAVITYPGGSVGNASVSWLSAMDQMTEVASHEIAEAVTDPNVNYKSLGWYDSALNGEVGDITNQQVTYLNGYAVQRISDKNDFAMTPAGATAAVQASFVLQNNGYLWEHTSSGWTYLSSGIASVSDQSVDNHGRAMVDVVTTGGLAYEYHDGQGWRYLWNGATSAKAGQGVSYVLFSNGTVDEFNDASGSWTYIYNNAVSIDAGTDRVGVNMVDIVFNWGDAWEHSDTSGWHFIGSNVKQVSAGQQGISDFVNTSGNAYWYNEATGGTSFLASNVAAITAGVDQFGKYMIDLLYNGGTAIEYRSGSGWSTLATGVASLSKARAGLLDVVFSGGAGYEHDAYGNWRYLTGSVTTAV